MAVICLFGVMFLVYFSYATDLYDKFRFNLRYLSINIKARGDAFLKVVSKLLTMQAELKSKINGFVLSNLDEISQLDKNQIMERIEERVSKLSKK